VDSIPFSSDDESGDESDDRRDDEKGSGNRAASTEKNTKRVAPNDPPAAKVTEVKASTKSKKPKKLKKRVTVGRQSSLASPSSSRKRAKIDRFSPGEHAVRIRLGLEVPSHKAAPDAKDEEEKLARDYVETMLVPDLKVALRERHAPVSGRKNDLVNRLLELMSQEREEKRAAATRLDMGPLSAATAAPAPEKSDDVMSVLKALVQQQSELVALMRDRNEQMEHHDHAYDHDARLEQLIAVSARKPAAPDGALASTDGRDRWVEIMPRSSASTYVGEHDMERYYRTNLEMAKLIHENAELRQAQLLHSMVHGSCCGKHN
jgi:hypothetical protein